MSDDDGETLSKSTVQVQALTVGDSLKRVDKQGFLYANNQAVF